jgi:hypothetical protein
MDFLSGEYGFGGTAPVPVFPPERCRKYTLPTGEEWLWLVSLQKKNKNSAKITYYCTKSKYPEDTVNLRDIFLAGRFLIRIIMSWFRRIESYHI